MQISTDYPALVESTIPAYLHARGLLDHPDDAGPIHMLSGGFANHVYQIRRQAAPTLILKQCFAQQIIDRGFDLPVDRLEKECRALQMIHTLDSDRSVPLPQLIEFDPSHNTGIFLAWENSRLYMDDLIAGKFSAAIGDKLGHALGRLHNLSIGQSTLEQQLGHNENHRVTLRVQAIDITTDSSFLAQIRQFIQDSIATNHILIHGDFDPKNILVNHADEVLMIDLEQVAVADPAQDVGYLLGHYYLLALHDGIEPATALPSAHATALGFWSRYFDTLSPALDHQGIAERALIYTWLFLLGRLDGLARLPAVQHHATTPTLRRLAHQWTFSTPTPEQLHAILARAILA